MAIAADLLEHNEVLIMIRAVIIDDEPAVGTIISRFAEQGDLPLEIVGFAYDGASGVNMIRDLRPDLVFLDVQMPLMNGFEVMQELPDAKYIIVTAFESFEYAQNALRLGASDILLKPVRFSQLMDSVSRVIGWKITDNPTVNEIAQYISKHYAERISLEQLSELFFLTPTHITKLFKKHTGENITVYINRIRINHAQVLLEQGMSVAEVSEVVGYPSLNNFYKQFKRFTGTTPASYHSSTDKL